MEVLGAMGIMGKKQKKGGKDFDSHPVMNWSLDHAEEAKVLGPRVSLSPRSKETLDDSSVI